MIRRSQVRWADGSYDSKRTCDECGKTDCRYPVYKDFYKEIVTRDTYWNYMDKQTGNKDTEETFTANPDGLED